MRSTNRKRALITSGAIVLLALTVIVGGTFALFTDTLTVSNHLKAGDLQITLKRTELTKTTLNDSGYLVDTTVQTTNDDPVNFDNPTDENVFGLTMENGEVTEKIAPGSKFVATMQIENNSDVAFGYWVRIVCEDEDIAKALAEQLIITVYTDKDGDGTIDTDNESDDSTMAKGLEVGNDKNFIGVLGVDDMENFIVSVEFEDEGYSYVDGVLSSTNDSAQLQDVNFDLVVYAVQVTTEPTAP